MLAKEIIIEQAKQIIIQKIQNLNIEKFMKLDFSLLCWQTIIIKLNIHQFEDGLRQYIGSYITLVEGQAKLQKIKIIDHQIEQDNDLIIDKPFYFNLDYLANDDEYYQILAQSECILTIIKDIRIQQIIKNYYSLCEYQMLESLSKIYFLSQETSVFVSMLIHDAQRYKLQKGQIIYKIDDPVNGFYLILEGEICIKKLIEIEIKSTIDAAQIKKKKKKLIIQGILGKDQCFGETDLFLNENKRNEQIECNSLECEIILISTHSLIEAYQQKLQDPKFNLNQLKDIFQEHILLKNKKQQDAINKYVLINKPSSPPKPEMKPTQPLFMNLQPLSELKKITQKDKRQVNRVSSMYLPNQIQQQQQKNQSSQLVIVNSTLAKMNRQDGLVSLQQYIENIKQVGKSGISKYQQNKKMKQNSQSVVTEEQQQMIDYVRQLTPLYIKKRQSLNRKSLPDNLGDYNYNRKQSYMMHQSEFYKV